jgi:2-oxoglutarate dehydrogenase E2 component (dihydrolipoamide succinyltransferase)
MATEVRIPELGESISEVQVADWMRAVGDVVAVDDPLAEIDSDKATVELPAPVGGKLVEIRVQAGEFCKVGDVVAVIDESAAGKDGGKGSAAAKPAAKERDGEQAAAPRAKAAPDRAEETDKKDKADEADRPERGDRRSGAVMPAARRVLDQAGIAADEVRGTGPGGRVLKEDAERAAADSRSKAPAAPAAAGTAGGREVPDGLAPRREAGSREERTRPMSPIRRRIAERLVAAQHTAALLTTFNEIDMTAVKAMRERHQEAFQARYGTKLGFMSFFTRAVIEALRVVPQLNNEIRGQEIVERDFCDIGIAIGSGKGLVVPVLRNAEAMSFGQIEQRIADFAARAQAKKLDLAELQGGTFTISNGGVYGSLLSTPIVNPPQSGVLGLHVIQDRPVVRDGEIVVRPMMYVALTYDHRLVDGREGVTFLRHIKECIEAPERMMLEI